MSGERIPPPTKLPNAITTPLSWVYALGINKKNRDYDAGKGVTRLDRPVISIGNLSTGGTGKTPMVHLVVQMLKDAGKNPVIAMRGYGAKPNEKGDEQREHELALPGVPIVAQPDRNAGLSRLFAGEIGAGIDCVVLDDGFQHRKIARDLDIVLIDATRPPNQDALLPKGHLRDPIESLSRAGLVVLTHCELVDEREINRIRAMVREYNTNAPVLEAQHVWESIVSYARTDHGWTEKARGLDELSGIAVRVVAGIGNAEAFVSQIRAHGIEFSQIFELRDHQRLSDELIEHLIDPANFERFAPIMMTRKDWVKVQDSNAWESLSRVWVPILRMQISEPEVMRAALKSSFSAG